MGSALGPIFYMSDLNNKIFNSIRKPSIYLRYVGDILVNGINEINILQDNFTHELSKNNKISILDVLIDTTTTTTTTTNNNNNNNNNNNFTTYTYKKTPLIITPIPSTLKVNAPSDIKKAIINNLISRANESPPKQYFIKK